MARRRELLDVADGITGQLIGPLDDTLETVERTITTDNAAVPPMVRLDAIEGSASDSALTSWAVNWRSELARHLAARGMPSNWVQAASIEIEVLDVGNLMTLMRCRVRLTDDRGVEFTSTRRSPIHRLT